MDNGSSPTSLSYRDDNRVLRYLLHNVKGIRPVSGGVIEDAMEREYTESDTDQQVSDELDFEF